MNHYISLGQIAEKYDTWKYIPPKYGHSNTDQSFYEPSSSRIQNSLKNGGSTTPESKVLSYEDCFNVPLKPNGITREELHSLILSESDRLDNDIKKSNEQTLLDKTLNNINDLISSETTIQETTSLNE